MRHAASVSRELGPAHRRAARSFVVFPVALAALASACSVSVSLEDRPCPCDEARGWFCDPSTNRCVTTAEGLCGVPGAELSSVALAELRVAWRTDTAFELAWTVAEADQQRLDHYELVIGEDREAVETRGEGAIVFDRTSSEHPELRRADLPGTYGGDPVDSVVVRGLEPNTTYYVQLVAYDDGGAVRCGRALEVLTYVPATRQHVLYDEEPFGSSIPECVDHVEDAALASSGSAFARFRAYCDPTGDAVCAPPEVTQLECFENVRLRDLGGPGGIAIEMPEGPFRELAHLQVDLALDDTAHAYWTELFLLTRAPDADEDPDVLPGPFYLWGAPPQTLVADGAYRTYTAPLSRMRLRCFDDQAAEEEARLAADPNAPRQCGVLGLARADLARGVTGVRVGATFRHEGGLRLDRAVIRY